MAFKIFLQYCAAKTMPNNNGLWGNRVYLTCQRIYIIFEAIKINMFFIERTFSVRWEADCMYFISQR